MKGKIGTFGMLMLVAGTANMSKPPKESLEPEKNRVVPKYVIFPPSIKKETMLREQIMKK